jgi:hypothetical protein
LLADARLEIGMRACLPLVLALALLGSPVQSAQADGDTSACTLVKRDADWLAQAVSAWRYASRGFMQLDLSNPIDVYIMNSGCLLKSSDAMTTTGAPTWTASRFVGTALLDGKMEVRPSPLSFAGNIDGQAFFVMSTPSVWQSVEDGDPFTLDQLMTAVWIHEGAHAVQNKTYFAQFIRAAQRLNLPEDWNDDSIQGRFENNPEFSASIDRETELLFAAASATSLQQARELANEALRLIEARRARWYVGESAGLGEVEDIFLTLEGSGQWAGYTWLIDPTGGNVAQDVAVTGFLKRGKWWSQVQGAALMLATDRIGGPGWRRHAFGDGQAAGMELLKAALLDSPRPAPP